MAELESKTIHSVAKAIRLLDLLAEHTKPATLTELYQATGWPKSTILGLLSTLREAGLRPAATGSGAAGLNMAVRWPMPGISARSRARICRKSAWNSESPCSCPFLIARPL